MNSKKLKLLRKAIRTQFPTWPARATTEGPRRTVTYSVPQLLPNGMTVLRQEKAETTGTITNVSRSHRGLYRACKGRAAFSLA